MRYKEDKRNPEWGVQPLQYPQEEDVKCFIQKPIDIDDLVKRIKEA